MPTPLTRDRVLAMATAGIAEAKIAKAVGISRPTLRARYAAELALARVRNAETLVEVLWRAAQRGHVASAARLAKICFRQLQREEQERQK